MAKELSGISGKINMVNLNKNMHRFTNTKGIELIKHFEGFKAESYICAGGHLTIGYGHKIRAEEKFRTISLNEAENILMKDLLCTERIVIKYIDTLLHDNQFAALVSFTFNMGNAALQRSILRQKVNYGLNKEAGREFLRWVYAGGSGYGSGGSSYSSQEKHIQQVNSALSGNLLGGAYHDGRKNRDKDDGINYQVKGIASQLNYYGFKDPKGIVLSDCALEDRDIYVLHQTLQYYPFNLTILDLSNNNLGLNSVHSIFYGMRGSQQGVVTHVCKQIKSINLSNNWLGDSSAKFIGEALEYGNVPSLKYLDVSGNQITPTGERYFAKALQSFMVKDIIITIRKYSTELGQKVIKPALKNL